MPLSEGWPDQYDRMLRSKVRLAEAAGPSSIGSDEARDRLYHFFQDAFHLRDWLLHDPTSAPVSGDLTGANNHIKATPALALCHDVCIGIKHLALSRPATGDSSTAITNQSVSVTPSTISVGVSIGGTPSRPRTPTPPATATHEWVITSDGRTCDAVDLADQVIAAWDDWLKVHGLL